MSDVKIVFGGASIGPNQGFADEDSVRELLAVLASEDVSSIDTAQAYQGSEELLGKVSAGSRFVLDTKLPGGWFPNTLKGGEIVNQTKGSTERLKVSKVNTLYIHAPDASIPISETLAGIDEAHRAGLFDRFGLSNYTAEGVTAVYEHCREKGYVLPTVYQGSYNAIARKQESVLLPTIRKLGMSFYAYSPLAGGLLTKTKQGVLNGEGNFDASTPGGAVYSKTFNRPAYLEALARWEAVAKDAGCSRAELGYRWLKYHSLLKGEHGDAMVVGARSIEQVKQTTRSLRAGPLADDVCRGVDAVWKAVEHEAPFDMYNQ